MNETLAVNLNAIYDHDVRNTVTDYATSIDAYGTITGRPGKFEGEPIWTVYFHELTMSGDGETFYRDCPERSSDEDAICDCELDSYDVFRIQAGDIETFPWLDDAMGHDLVIWTDSQGFTMSRVCANGHEAWAKLYYGN